jgi:flagellar M-ring protein FliF
MGFLNQALAQLRELFASMTPAARITSALLLGVIVVSLGYLFKGYAGASEEFLFDGAVLQPRDADRIEMALAKAKLTILPRQAGRIVVPRGQKTAYLAAIVEAGAMPPNFDALLDQSLDSGLFESGETRRARLKAARERQLSMIISDMDGIQDAKVLYDIREPVAFEHRKVTATVSVLPETAVTLDPQRVKMIRKAVAGAVAGLEEGDVAVINQGDGSQYVAGGADVPAELFDSPLLKEKTIFEQQTKGRIESLLNYIRPSVHVQVTAELDDLLSSETHTLKLESEPQPIRTTTQSRTNNKTQTEDRAQPGPVANGPNGPPAEQAIAKNENNEEVNNTETENAIPTTDETQRRTGLTPKHVRAAIAVPSEYLVRIWRERTPDQPADAKPDATLMDKIEEEVRSKIKASVAQLFPIEVAEKQLGTVEVTVFQSLTPEPVVQPSIAKEGLLWASRNSGSLIMAGLAVVSLMMLRSMMKAIPAADKSPSFGLPALAMETVTESPAAAGKPAAGGAAPSASNRDPNRPRLRLKKGPTLKDDLTELVKEDPDGAAAILRTWIGSAA